MITTTLPVLIALSWVPVTVPVLPVQVAPAAPQKAEQPAKGVGTITCPITGEEIPACCCPAKK